MYMIIKIETSCTSANILHVETENISLTNVTAIKKFVLKIACNFFRRSMDRKQCINPLNSELNPI